MESVPNLNWKSTQSEQEVAQKITETQADFSPAQALDESCIESKIDCPREDGLTEKKSVFGGKREKLILLAISIYWFTGSCAYSMIGPFFPGEAKAKGSNTTITGFIFAVFPLVMILMTPVIGIVLPIIGAKFTLIAGLFVEGGTQILFAFVGMMPNGTIFITFCFLIRIVSALGATATWTASLTLLTLNFHENISPAMGVMETFGGFGMIAGPAIGGFLYKAGGFKLPFLFLGALIFLTFPPILFILPPDDKDKDEQETDKAALWHALKIPAVALVAYLCITCCIALTFIEPTLQEHLQKPFHLNVSQIGLIFLITSGIYALTAPFIGYIADRKDTRFMMMIGGVVAGFSYILLGPSPFLPKSVFPRTLWLNGVALALLGIGAGSFIVPALSDMNKSVQRYGMQNNLATNSALSSIFNTAFNIGAISGPALGGIMLRYITFAWATTIVGFFLIVSAVILAIFTFIERRNLRSKVAAETESKHLISDNDADDTNTSYMATAL